MSTTTLMTFAEFEKLPQLPGKQELIDGELILMPPPDQEPPPSQ
jgi:Uma2 family endonuclease